MSTKHEITQCTHCGSEDRCSPGCDKRTKKVVVVGELDLFRQARSTNALADRKGFTVYFGYDKRTGELVYIGTTVQVPKDRFRWHKHNGKDLRFEVHKQYPDEQSMLDAEFELIRQHNPRLNKITARKQNMNRRLTQDQLDARRGDAQWCQSCLKRRVNPGYTKCMRC